MPKTMLELARNLYDAGLAEDEAKKKRIEAEEAIAALVETGDVGSKTVDVGEGLKVVVKRGIIYKADVDGIRELGEMVMPAGVKLPLTYVAPQPASYVFDEKAYEDLHEKCPAAFEKIAPLVTTKPRKVSVTLKLA
jgi:hypothetical protein